VLLLIVPGQNNLTLDAGRKATDDHLVHRYAPPTGEVEGRGSAESPLGSHVSERGLSVVTALAACFTSTKGPRDRIEFSDRTGSVGTSRCECGVADPRSEFVTEPGAAGRDRRCPTMPSASVALRLRAFPHLSTS